MLIQEGIPYSRREFVRTGLGLVGLSATVPTFLAQTVMALGRSSAGRRFGPGRGGKDGRILVVVQLAGGNDGLNTIVPYRDDAYYRARPTLAIKKDDLIRIDDAFGFHSGAKAMMSLWDDGVLGVVHGVGYPNPDRSHFVGTRIWHSASPKGRMATGWLGRYFDSNCTGTIKPDPRCGIALDSETPLVMRGERFMPVSVKDPENWRIFQPGERTKKKRDRKRRRERGPDDVSKQTALDFLRRSALDATVYAKEIRTAARTTIDGAAFPNNGFAKSLRSIARMIAADMPTSVYYASLGGFDTHAGQTNSHANVLRTVSEGLRAFVDALRRTGNLERTLVLTFTEFGRRVAENASGGTDHGAAGPMFLIGGAVRGGFHGTMPSLGDLHRGDLKHNVDFRQVYATVLREWMGADADRILGAHWNSLPILNV